MTESINNNDKNKALENNANNNNELEKWINNYDILDSIDLPEDHQEEIIIKKSDNSKSEDITIKKEDESVGDLINSLNMPETREKATIKRMQDININSFEDILKELILNNYDFVTFEPTNQEVIINFRKDKAIVKTKTIRYATYSNVLLKAKSEWKLVLENTQDEQESSREINYENKTIKLTVKTVPSNLGEKLFLKAILTEKKSSNKQVKKTSIKEILYFLIITLVIALIIWGSFLAFIVLNAQTVDDVRFFEWLWISLNDINTFIAQAVNIIFTWLVLIEVILLVIVMFRAFLIKKEFKKKKRNYAILSIIMFIITFSTASAWMGITQRIEQLPNWLEKSFWDIQIYDNDKLISNNFDKASSILTNTNSVIWPVNLRFDISNLAESERRRWITITSYEWTFNSTQKEITAEPTLIKNFSNPIILNTQVKIIWTNIQWGSYEKVVEWIPTINIWYSVSVEETILMSWGKIISFNAENLQQLWSVSWYNINDLKTPLASWYRFITDKPVFEDTIFVMKVNAVDSEIIKLFMVSWGNEVEIDWEIEFTRWNLNDLEVIFRVINIKNSQWLWYIEKYIWNIWSQKYTKEWDINNPEKSSEFRQTFINYWEYEIKVELINSAWEIRTLSKIINLDRVLKVSTPITIIADSKTITDTNYNQAVNEYMINWLWIPNKMQLDWRYVRVDSTLYVLNEIEWDLDADGNIDYIWKIANLDINSEWNYEVIAHLKFANRRNQSEITNITQHIYIEAIKKEYDIDFEIIPNSEYAPTIVKLDASKSYVTWANIVRFNWDYGDGTTEIWDAIIQGHRYSDAWDYIIKLTVTTQDWRFFSTTKTLILKPVSQTAKASVSMRNAPVWQWIDFSSAGSVWQVSNYYWDFWDWEISTQANPTHSYKKAWTYKITLRIEFTNRNIMEDVVEVNIY